MSSGNTEKFFAVVFSVLMVLSVFAGTVAFAGGATAQTAVDSQASEWPMPNGDSARTSYNPSSDGPRNITLDWDGTTGKNPGVVSQPVIVNNTVYVVGVGGNVTAVDADTGTVEWSERIFTDGGNEAYLAVDNGTGYVANETDVVAFSLSNGNADWRYENPAGVTVTDLTVSDGSVFFGVRGQSDQTTVYALDAVTGTESWTYDAQTQAAGIAVENGTVIATGEDQSYNNEFVGVWIAALEMDGSERWSATIEPDNGFKYDSDEPPAISNGTAYVPVKKAEASGITIDEYAYVYAYDVTDGTQSWVANYTSDVSYVPKIAVANDTVYAQTSEVGEIFALDSGTVEWSTSAFDSESSWETPVVADETIYIGNSSGYLHAFDAGTGDIVFTEFTLPNPKSSIADGTVYVAQQKSDLQAWSDATTDDGDDSESVIKAPSDGIYSPTSPFTIGTGHDATGEINSGDVAVRLVNVTAGNDTVVAVNNSAPVAGDVNTTISASSLSGNITIETQLYNSSSDEVVATDTANFTAEGSTPVIKTPSDGAYNPTFPFTIGTAHDAAGEINSGDVAVRLVNVTAGNDTVVAVNDSAPVAGDVNTTIPASGLSGDVTIEAQLYDSASDEVVATDTANFTAETTSGEPDTESLSAVVPAESVEDVSVEVTAETYGAGPAVIDSSLVNVTVGVVEDGGSGVTPVENVLLTVTLRDQNSDNETILAENVTTGGDGNLVVSFDPQSQPDGIYRVVAEAQNFSGIGSSEVRIGPEPIITTTSDFSSGTFVNEEAQIGLRLLDNRQPVNGSFGEIEITDPDGNVTETLTPTTDDTGTTTISFTPTKEGTYSIQQTTGPPLAINTDVEVSRYLAEVSPGDYAAGGQLSIPGYVYNSSEPYANSDVQLRIYDDRPSDEDATVVDVVTATTNEQGFFIARTTAPSESGRYYYELEVPPGNQVPLNFFEDRFRVEDTGTEDAASTPSLTASFEPRFTQYSRGDTATAQLELTDQSGEPISDADVRVVFRYGFGETVAASTVVQTNSTGEATTEFTIPDTAPRGTNLRLSAEANVSGTIVTASEGGGPIQDHFIEVANSAPSPGEQAEIPVSVTDADGNPVSGITYTYDAQGEYRHETFTTGKITTNASGQATIPVDIPPTLDRFDIVIGGRYEPGIDGSEFSSSAGTSTPRGSNDQSVSGVELGLAVQDAQLNVSDDRVEPGSTIQVRYENSAAATGVISLGSFDVAAYQNRVAAPGETVEFTIPETADGGDSFEISVLAVDGEQTRYRDREFLSIPGEGESGTGPAPPEDGGGGGAGAVVVNETASSVSPDTAPGGEEQEFAVSLRIEDTSLADDDSGEVDVFFEGFQVGDGTSEGLISQDLTIDYTAANVSNGTLTVSTNVTAVGPPVAGEVRTPVFVTDLRRTTDSGESEFLLEDQFILVDTITVEDAFGREQLNLTANTTQLSQGETVEFTVTDESETPVNATVIIPGSETELRTGEDGTVTTQLSQTGQIEAVALKRPEEGANGSTTQFAPGAVELEVSRPTVDVSAAQVDFGDVPPGGVVQSNVTVTNNASVPVEIDPFITGAEAIAFDVTNAPAEIPANSDANITVGFIALDPVTANAELVVGTNTVQLVGTGAAPQVEFETEIPVEITSQGSAQNATITVNNTGNTDLNASLESQSTAGDAAFDHPGTLNVSSGSTASFDIQFDAGVVSERRAFAELAVRPEGESAPPRVIPVVGFIEEPDINIRSGTLAFGDTETPVVVNDAEAQVVIVENTGTTTESLNATASGSAFSVIDTPSTFTLNPGESQRVVVEVNASTSGSPTGTLTVENESDASVSDTVGLEATVAEPTVALAESVSFGATPVDSGAAEEVTITNTGDAPLRASLSVSDNNFTVIGESELEVPANSSETVRVGFTPTERGDVTAELTVETNDPSATDADETIELNASAIESDVGVGRTTVTFGSVGLADSETETLTLTNNGDDVEITNATVTGATGFTEVSDVEGQVVGDGETLTVEIEFTPEATGTQTGSFSLTAETDAGQSRNFSTGLTGTGQDSELQVAPLAVRTGVAVAGGETTGSVNLENVGPAGTELTVDNVSLANSNFELATAPADGTTLASGENQTLTVAFVPDETASSGEQTAELVVNASGGERTFTERIPVTGIVSAPEPVISTTAVDAGSVEVGEPARETITLSNEGGEPYTVSVDSGNARLVGPSEVVPGGETTVALSITPDETGSFSTSVDIERTADDASLSTATVTLSGTAVAPEIAVAPTNITFSDTQTGSASQQDIQISNTGNATLEVAPPELAGDEAFTLLSGDRTLRIAPGNSQNISLGFQPTTSGEQTAELTLTPNSPAADPVTITGISGTATAAEAGLNDSTVSFGDVGVATENTQTLQIENDGNAPLQVTGSAVTGSDPGVFSIEGLNRPVIAGGETATFDVTVNTTNAARGTLSSELVINTNGSAGTLTAFAGASVAEPDIEVTPSVDADAFGTTRLGETNTAELTVNNTGTGPLNLTDVTVTGDDAAGFTIIEQPSEDIPEQSSGEVTIQFDPAAVSNETDRAQSQGLTASATLNVSSDDPDDGDGTVTVDLTGDGETPAFEVPRTLGFGDTPIGETSTTQVTVENAPEGTAPLNITNIEVTGTDSRDYEASLNGSDTPQSLAPGDTATIDVNLTPSSFGQRFATLSIETNDTRQPVKKIGLSNSETTFSVDYGSVNVSYINPNEASQEPTVNVDEGLQGRNATLRTVNSNASTTSDYTLNFTTDASAAAFGQSELANDTVNGKETTTTPFRYINATTSADDQNFTESTFRVTVSKAVLAEQNVTPANVTIYHENTSSSYDRLETELLFETPRGYVYEATTENYSVFAIGGTPDDVFTGDGSDDSDGPDDSDDSDTTGSDGGDSSSGGAPPAPEQIVEGDATAESSFDGRTLSTRVDSATAGSSLTASLDDNTVNNNIENTGASLNSLTTTFADDVSNANFDTTYSATNPSNDVPDLSSQTNADEVAYVNVETNVEEDDIDSVTFEFSVSRDRLSDAGVSPEDVALYRFNDGEYSEYDASIESEGDDRITYTVESPGLSVFAIGEATEQVTDTATPEPDTVTPEPETATPESDTATTEPDTEIQTTTDTGTPGFGPITAIAALLALAFAVLRRRM